MMPATLGGLLVSCEYPSTLFEQTNEALDDVAFGTQRIETMPDRLPRSEFLRQIAPRCARPQDPENTVHIRPSTRGGRRILAGGPNTAAIHSHWSSGNRCLAIPCVLPDSSGSILDRDAKQEHTGFLTEPTLVTQCRTDMGGERQQLVPIDQSSEGQSKADVTATQTYPLRRRQTQTSIEVRTARSSSASRSGADSPGEQ